MVITMIVSILAIILVPLLLSFLLLRGGKKKKQPHQEPKILKLPPGPPTLPIIGNLHQVGSIPHKSFWRLSRKYGHVMKLQLGRTNAIVISSPEAAKQVLKDHDLECCSRPLSSGPMKLTYNFLDVAFSPYSDYWSEMRKIFICELLSMRRVQMFGHVREEQIDKLMDILVNNPYPNSVNLTELIFNVIDGVLGTIAFGGIYGQDEFKQRFLEVIRDTLKMLAAFHYQDYFPTFGRYIDLLSGKIAKHDEVFRNLDGFFEKVLDQHMDPNRPKPEKGNEDIVDILVGLYRDQTTSFHLTKEHLKAIIMDVFVGGTESTAVAITWAFSELLKNPRIMRKAQEEIRGIVGKSRKRVEGKDTEKFTYLKMVIKETFRMHPPAPIMIPHMSMKHIKVGGFDVLPGTTIVVNAYALGRDPKIWENSDQFLPERFENSGVDFKGSHFELVPFGAGRRICPGLAMGTTSVMYTLANLLYGFDYELPNGMRFEEFPLIEEGVLTVHNKQPLIVIPKKYQWKD